jgi:pimeloyl-ACP methyl ester carboxylesterase
VVPRPAWPLIVVLALIGSGSGFGFAAQSSAAAAPSPSALLWTDCQNGFQCATLKVPIDYAQPSRGSLDLALIRRPAEDPIHRVGSLVTNPGGPGAAGTQDLRLTAARYPPELRARFDLVSFDPRGVGMSSPVHCLDPPQLATYDALDFAADTPDEATAARNAQAQLAQACQTRYGRLLPFLSTTATARDLDRIRAALGDAKLTYFGASYGTYLGAVYAHLFPKRVRALVLDGAVDPALSTERLLLDQAVGYEQALQAFLADCAARPDCPLRARGDPTSVYDSIVAAADQAGIPAPELGDRRLGAGDLATAVGVALIGGEPLRQVFASALADAASGDASSLLFVSDSVNRFVDISANASIACNGPLHLARRDLSRLDVLAAQARARAPHFGLAGVYSAFVCAVWPVHGPAPAPLGARRAAPILVIGTQHDPATPLPWAQGLARELRAARLLIAPGYSHTSFALERESSPGVAIPPKQCVDDIGIRYLVDLTAPKNGTSCS